MRVTVDASVAAKWFFAEDHGEQTRHRLAPRIERNAPALRVVLSRQSARIGPG